MSYLQISEKIKNITSFSSNIIDLWSEFKFGDRPNNIKTLLFKFKIKQSMLEVWNTIVDMAKFILGTILLAEQIIEAVVLLYLTIKLISSMPALTAFFGKILLFISGSYVLIFNKNSNILHSFMPAFLKVDTDQRNSTKALASLTFSQLLLRHLYLALRVIMVSFGLVFAVSQLHSIGFVNHLLLNSAKVLPSIKLIGVYLLALGSGFAVSEIYAKISKSFDDTSKEINASLVAISTVLSMLFAVPVSVYFSSSFISVLLPLMIVSTGIMRTAFVGVLSITQVDNSTTMLNGSTRNKLSSTPINHIRGSSSQSQDKHNPSQTSYYDEYGFDGQGDECCV